jgi:TRAP-type C4-dicarboxylate transport system permease small subunit
MNSFIRALTKFDNLLAKGEAWVLVSLVVVMTVVVFLQVVYRYLLTQPLHWSEEMARYLFVWISLLGAALSVQKRGHFGMDFFFRMLPPRARRSLTVLLHLLVGVVIIVLLFYGILLVQKTADQQSPAMEIPMAWAYACLPVGAALMLIHLLSILAREAVEKKETSEGR